LIVSEQSAALFIYTQADAPHTLVDAFGSTTCANHLAKIQISSA